MRAGRIERWRLAVLKPVDGARLAPVAVLALLVLLYIGVFGTLTWRQQSNFGTFGFDMGIYDQGIWLVSRFKEPFLTVRGLNYFAHHVNLITVLFVPFYWLGAGPHFLYLVETVVMALGAIPVWLLCRDLVDDAWTALVPAGAFLLFPSFEWINWWHFHPDALIITPLLFAWWLATRERWRWFSVAVFVALLCKEDAALAVIMLGLVLVITGRRRAGARTMVAGAAWFLLATQLIIPLANGGSAPFYEQLFPGFGHSMTEIAYNMVRHPSRIINAALEPDRLVYFRKLLLPVGLMPLAAPLLLFVGAPQTVVNVVSGHPQTHDIRFHYSSILVAAVFLATVYGYARLVRRGDAWRTLAVVALAVSAVVANREWSPSPISRSYRSGIWATPQPKHAAVKEALKLVQPDDAVTASYYLVPHLTHRVKIYEFPNPFKVANWAVNGENPPPVDDVDTLVLDVTLNGDQQALYERLVAPEGEFRILFQRDGIVVAKRKLSVLKQPAAQEARPVQP